MFWRQERSSLPVLSHSDALAANMADFVLLCGRILLAWIFIRSGYGKLFNIPAYSASFPTAACRSFSPTSRCRSNFFGGLAILLGVATRYVVLVMIVFMLVATFSSHRYWDFSDATARRAQDTNFYKNIAMLGGFLFLFVSGPGRLSLDGWLRHKG
jgi:putative oxidoreductase